MEFYLTGISIALIIRSLDCFDLIEKIRTLSPPQVRQILDGANLVIQPREIDKPYQSNRLFNGMEAEVCQLGWMEMRKQ